jgi:hypothetical protein
MWQVRNGDARIADLQYGAGIPYPARVELYDRGETIGVLALVGFDRGTAELREPGGGQLPAPIEIEMAPRTDWMFDETGIDHPFPMSKAVTYARNDPANDLSAWLADHPAAYIVDASYWDYESVNGDTIEWRLAWRDHQDLFHVHIGKRDTVPDDGPSSVVDDLIG